MTNTIKTLIMLALILPVSVYAGKAIKATDYALCHAVYSKLCSDTDVKSCQSAIKAEETGVWWIQFDDPDDEISAYKKYYNILDDAGEEISTVDEARAMRVLCDKLVFEGVKDD